MGQKRIEYIDLAKGFCILLVIFTHVKSYYMVNTPIDLCLSSFRMPLYFILSGLFFKEYNGIFSFLRKKVNKLLIPFGFFYVIIALTLPIIINLFYTGFIKNHGVDYFFCFYNENFNGMPMGIWFLWCLFIVNILFYILMLVFKRTNYIMSMSMLLGFCGYYLGYKGINLPLYLDSAITALPFFCFGYILKHFTNVLYPNRFDRYLLILSLLCFVIVYIFAYDKVSFRKNEFYVNVLSVYICGFLGSLGILFISKKIKSLKFVSFIGRYSIMVLCTHQIVLLAIYLFMKYINCNVWLAVLYTFILTSIVSYLLIYPMKKYLPSVTAQKDII